MRVFAGPNGSGKSTLKSVIDAHLLGVYVNADEIETAIRTHGYLDLEAYHVHPSEEQVLLSLAQSPFLSKMGVQNIDAFQFRVVDGKLYISTEPLNAYMAAALADFVREELLNARVSFTFETVMSSRGKVDFMRKALDSGYRVYLYYIATADPAINISRVQNRVKMGGHDVPVDKIESRYHRSLDLLYDAIRNSSRAFIFDNSTDDKDKVWIAEGTDGLEITPRVDEVPAWFAEAVIDKANG